MKSVEKMRECRPKKHFNDGVKGDHEKWFFAHFDDFISY